MHEPSLVVSSEKVILGPFERKLVRAQVISIHPNEYHLRNVMIRHSGVHKRCPFVSEDTLTSVGDEGTVFLAVRNTTSFEKVTLNNKTVLGKAEPTHFVFQPVAAESAAEIDAPLVEQVNRVHAVDLLSEMSSEFSSFDQNFLSSTEMSEEGLSENEKRARTDPQLLKPIAGPDLSSVLSSWGEGARDQLASVLSEYGDLFMKHKADKGRCQIAKHRKELEPEAIPHREGARSMSPDKAAKANQEVRNLLAIGLIQPSHSPWASGIVMVKKKTGELRFCCDVRPLNDVTVKDAFPLPRMDESLSRIGNAKIFTSIDLAWAFWQIPLKKCDRRKTAFACELGLFEWRRKPFWAVQCLSHLSTCNHESPAANSTKSRERRLSLSSGVRLLSGRRTLSPGSTSIHVSGHVSRWFFFSAPLAYFSLGYVFPRFTSFVRWITFLQVVFHGSFWSEILLAFRAFKGFCLFGVHSFHMNFLAALWFAHFPTFGTFWIGCIGFKVSSVHCCR